MSRCVAVAKLVEPPYRSYRCDHTQGHLGEHASIADRTKLSWANPPELAELVQGIGEAFERALVGFEAERDDTHDFNRPHLHFRARPEDVGL